MLKYDLNNLYETHGCRRFRLPAFEPYDLYAANRDYLGGCQLITFTDLDGTLMALPPDVTLSVLRSSAKMDRVRVYYNASVYRPKDGHFREIPQAGIEYLGRIDEQAEADVLLLACRSLQLVSDDAILRISDVSFLHTLLEDMALPEETAGLVMKLFSVKNAAGMDRLAADHRLTTGQAALLKTLADLYLPFADGVSFLEKQKALSACADTIAHLRRLSDVLGSSGAGMRFYLDFSLVNSMDYYSGVLFQGAVRDIPFPVLNGGRYDGLAEKTGRSDGAIGFCVYLDMIENYRGGASA